MLIFVSIIVGIVVMFSWVFGRMRPRTFLIALGLWLALLLIAYYLSGGK